MGANDAPMCWKLCPTQPSGSNPAVGNPLCYTAPRSLVYADVKILVQIWTPPECDLLFVGQCSV